MFLQIGSQSMHNHQELNEQGHCYVQGHSDLEVNDLAKSVALTIISCRTIMLLD